MKRAQLKELMREIDTDGSGEVDFDEARVYYVLYVYVDMLDLRP